METVRIRNDATYSPIALTDLALAAPLLSRILLGATPVGRAVQAAALAVYAGSAVQDWQARRGVRKVDFHAHFGADLKRMRPMPLERRWAEVEDLAAQLNRSYLSERRPRARVAVEVDEHLTDYIAGITGQRIETSTEVRSFALAGLIFPFALGACDILSGDVAIFRDTGIFEPHVIVHEFAHRKGYVRELEAQVLAYNALALSGDPFYEQTARAERLHRHLKVLSRVERLSFEAMVDRVELRQELRPQFLVLDPDLGVVEQHVSDAMRTLYDARMKLTGQNGLTDYDEGFTNFLYTVDTGGAEAA